MMSKKGIDNPNNAACIKQVAGFLNKPSSNRVSTNKLVYITHGFGDGIEQKYLNCIAGARSKNKIFEKSPILFSSLEDSFSTLWLDLQSCISM